jgi:hypothetical protein
MRASRITHLKKSFFSEPTAWKKGGGLSTFVEEGPSPNPDILKCMEMFGVLFLDFPGENKTQITTQIIKI